jgi:hypothetical protein
MVSVVLPSRGLAAVFAGRPNEKSFDRTSSKKIGRANEPHGRPLLIETPLWVRTTMARHEQQNEIARC